MVDVEEPGVPQLVGAEDAGVVRVSLHVQLQGGRVEDVGEVQVFLPGDVGQVSLGLVHGLGQAELSQVFLEETKRNTKVKQLLVGLLMSNLMFRETATIYLQVVADIQ